MDEHRTTTEIENIVVQLLNCVWLSATRWTAAHHAPMSSTISWRTRWTAAHHAPMSSTISWSLLKFMSVELVMLSNHLSQHQGLFSELDSLYQVAKVLELQLQHQSLQWIFRLISFRTDWLDLLAFQGALKIFLLYFFVFLPPLLHLFSFC